MARIWFKFPFDQFGIFTLPAAVYDLCAYMFGDIFFCFNKVNCYIRLLFYSEILSIWQEIKSMREKQQVFFTYILYVEIQKIIKIMSKKIKKVAYKQLKYFFIKKNNFTSTKIHRNFFRKAKLTC